MDQILKAFEESQKARFFYRSNEKSRKVLFPCTGGVPSLQDLMPDDLRWH